MRRRGETRGPRCVSMRDDRRGRRCASALAAALFLVLPAVVGAVAFAAAGCGGSHRTADLAPFVGRWERVEAGAPNLGFSLDSARSGDGVRLTFANHTNGLSQTVAGVARGGGIACALPTGDTGAGATPGATPGAPRERASPSPSGVPTEVDLLLSIDDSSGQLVIDLVFSDGTLEPIWIYDGVDGVSPSATDGVSPSAPGTV